MVAKTYSKLQVAGQQLDTALRLYFLGKEPFSAITLAGAAEEILAVYLKVHGQQSAFDQDVDASLRVYRWMWSGEGSRVDMHKLINRVKNNAKHMKGKKDTKVRCDARTQAKQALDRAVSNYYALMQFEDLRETPRIRRFNAHLVGKRA